MRISDWSSDVCSSDLSTNDNQKVYYHRLGTPQSQDQLVYATPDRPKLGHSAQVSDDGRWLLITSSQGTDERFELAIADLSNPARTPWPLIKGLEHDWRLVGNVATKLYFLTKKGDQQLRLVKLDAQRPNAPPVEIVQEREETLAGGTRV